MRTKKRYRGRRRCRKALLRRSTITFSNFLRACRGPTDTPAEQLPTVEPLAEVSAVEQPGNFFNGKVPQLPIVEPITEVSAVEQPVVYFHEKLPAKINIFGRSKYLHCKVAPDKNHFHPVNKAYSEQQLNNKTGIATSALKQVPWKLAQI